MDLRMIARKLVLVPSCCEVTWLHTDMNRKQVQRGGVDKSQTEVAEEESDGWDLGTLAQSRVHRIIVKSPHQRRCPFAHALVKIDRYARHVVLQCAMKRAMHSLYILFLFSF